MLHIKHTGQLLYALFLEMMSKSMKFSNISFQMASMLDKF